jgi:hypothetical protein
MHLSKTMAWIMSALVPMRGRFARDNHFVINYSAFEDTTRPNLEFERVIGWEKWGIYEVKTPNILA